MVTLNYKLLTQQEYVDVIVDFITTIEGESASVYKDSDGKATIGYGYTFNRSNNVALWTAANIQLTPSQLALLQQIDAESSDAQKTQLGMTFSKTVSHTEAVALLRQTYPEYEAPADALNMPPSVERAAFVSLSYNRGVPIVNKKMQDFLNAVQTGDRAEAWYQMRYNSFGNAQGSSTTKRTTGSGLAPTHPLH